MSICRPTSETKQKVSVQYQRWYDKSRRLEKFSTYSLNIFEVGGA
ncbi:hypothetical protein CEXT_659111, partial [Caerostris extrusa]